MLDRQGNTTCICTVECVVVLIVATGGQKHNIYSQPIISVENSIEVYIHINKHTVNINTSFGSKQRH